MNMDTYNLLSIDPGSQTLGLCVYTICSKTNIILNIRTKTIHLDKLPMNNLFDTINNKDDKLLSLHNFIKALLIEEQPLAVVIESPFFNRFSPKAYGVLTEVVTYVKLACYSYSVLVNVTMVEPLAVKKAVGVGYRDGKEGVSNSVKNMDVFKPFIHANMTEHEFDAIAIGWWFYMSNIKE